jgi:UPF0716 protein FxsA
MGIALRLAVVALPLMEIAAFVLVGQAIGVGATLLLVLLAAVVGGFIVKSRGLALLARMRDMARRGEWPGAELFDEFLLILAGLLFILPGFVSDAVAIALLFGPLRRGLYHWGRSFVGRAAGARQGPGTIETEYREIRPDVDALQGPSRWGKGEGPR